MNPALRFWLRWSLLAAGLVCWAQCDTVTPQEEALLVVEAFIDAEQPLPSIRLWRTRPLNDPFPFDATTAVSDADLTLTLSARQVRYQPSDLEPGLYTPTDAPLSAHARAPLSLEAFWRDQTARATTTVPPSISIDSLRVDVPAEPIAGIILDSLFFDPARIDSLQLDSVRTGAEQGFVYLVEVKLWWHVGFAEVGADSSYWVRTQLRPVLSTRPALDDFFFKPEQILRERTLEMTPQGGHAWLGVYAIPVDAKDEPMPRHPLRVALLRSGPDYARYANSRNDPERREPLSNVEGALGIVAGISVDTLWVTVE